MISKDFIELYEHDSKITKEDMKNIMCNTFPSIKKSVIRKDAEISYEEISYNEASKALKDLEHKEVAELSMLYKKIFESVWSVNVIEDILEKIKILPRGECYYDIIKLLFLSLDNKSLMDLDLNLSKAMRYKYKDESLIIIGFRLYFALISDSKKVPATC